jgi:hypothetical protein
MAEASTTPAPHLTPSRHVQRLVLFGMPAAGKSSLLGALAQAAQTQEHLLNGHLTDLSKGLAELKRRLYEDQPQETLEEVVPYPISFEPFVPYEQGIDRRTEVVLVDCDGRVANDLLARRRALLTTPEEGTLAQAILDTDTLVLVIDAAAAASHVDAEFAEFDRFLSLLEQNRGRRSDIGGLPVFLVLTKCDLLAQPTDTPAGWIERIEARKREVNLRFQDFLAGRRAEGPVPFGSVDLHLWATAVKRPALVGSPAKPREPYGVAELFRQAFETARHFQEMRAHAGRRLVWTMAGSTGLVAALLALTGFLFVNRPSDEQGPRELLNKIESYRTSEPQTPSSRLREPLQPRISALSDLQNDPDFGRLPQEKQEYVSSRLRELQQYQEYKDKLLRMPPVAGVRSQRELDELETSLTHLALPEGHRSDWSQTEASLFRAQSLSDLKALRAAVIELEDWYRRLMRRGEEFWTFSGQKSGAPASWPDWLSQAQGLLLEAASGPHRPAERLPGSSLTYDTVFRFDRVTAAKSEWSRLQVRLERVANLSAALGLAGPVPERTPLDIPAGFSVDQAATRVQQLEKVYPRFQEQFTLADLPEAISGEVRRAATLRYDHLLNAGRHVVLRHLQEANAENPDTPENWRRLRAWLANPEELKSWRVLATVLARLVDAASGDPVTALDTFLRQERFSLTLRRVILEIPDDVKLRPAGKLAAHHRTGDESRPTLDFELLGDERRDAQRRLVSYTFQPTGEGTLSYRPGDILWVDLPVKRAEEPDWLLTWAANRSQVFQFERLDQRPRLHRKGQPNSEGAAMPAITLEVVPEDGIPKVPDLLPPVPLK